MSAMESQIEIFLSSPAFGVAGASVKREKYGNKVVRCYQQNQRKVHPVNPNENVIEGEACVASVLDLPHEVKSLSIITPPQITEKVVEQAIARGIENVWMQPGAQNDQAIKACEDAGVNVIADGACILVVLGYHE